MGRREDLSNKEKLHEGDFGGMELFTILFVVVVLYESMHLTKSQNCTPKNVNVIICKLKVIFS